MNALVSLLLDNEMLVESCVCPWESDFFAVNLMEPIPHMCDEWVERGNTVALWLA